MESDEDWINFDSKLLYDSSIKLYIRNTKDAKDFDLNVATNRGFDLNNYLDDDEEAFGKKRIAASSSNDVENLFSKFLLGENCWVWDA